jgi:hypothetical protein
MSENIDSIGRDTALEFIKRIERAMGTLGEAGEALRAVLAKDDFRIFADAVGAIVGELDLGVLEIIYRCHPDLRPSDQPKAPTLRQIEECGSGSCRIDRKGASPDAQLENPS